MSKTRSRLHLRWHTDFIVERSGEPSGEHEMAHEKFSLSDCLDRSLSACIHSRLRQPTILG